MQMNTHYQDLKESYLFTDIAKRIRAFQEKHPDRDIIRMGIGDVTLPLPASCVSAMQEAAAEQGTQTGFHGYGPEQGYAFLREALAERYAKKGVTLQPNEIFISDGAKSDLGNLLDLFGKENTVVVPDPVYPVYVDTNIMAGRKIVYCNATKENGFLPLPDESCRGDLYYLCSPNNPTGAVYTKEGLKAWVDFALENDGVILFDAAYESFITDSDLPASIYEIEGAEKCAIEVCSFSKMAGFTGTRCGWTVVPEALCRQGMSLNRMWLRRQTTKFNGVSYVVQKGAAAAFTPEGEKEMQANLAYYRENAVLLAELLKKKNIFFTGGAHSPYLWFKAPAGLSGWELFDRLLEEAGVVGTPGEGFGENGSGFFRLTAFSTHEKTAEAVKRLDALTWFHS